jgi:hypothetical protein
MKKLQFLFFSSFILFSCSLLAQSSRFIYIQSENKQPFYAIVGGVNYSSSPNGYLTLSKLPMGNCNFVIGFAKNQYPEQKFVLNLQNDEGYSLKQANGKDWSLFNLQDFTTVMANQAVADNNVAKETEAAPVVTPPPAASAAVSEKVTVHIGVTKSFEKVGSTGIDQVYIDRSNTSTDTIAVFIPASNTNPVSSVSNNNVITNVKQCVVASDDDFRKARLQLASAVNETEMLQAAGNIFKEKCFLTEQLKNLGALFLSEENRCTFFIDAKQSVADKQNYLTLQSQLNSSGLIRKFKSNAQ